MKRAFVLGLAFAVTFAACGGGEEEATPAPTPAPNEAPAAPAGNDQPTADQPTPSAPPAGPDATTAPDSGSTADPVTPEPGEGASSDFCQFIASVDASQSGLDDGFDSSVFRTAMEETVAGLERARDLAPSEIRDDVNMVLDTFLGFAELLEEYDYNFLAMGTAVEKDPRILALEQPEFIAATDRIGDFCGLDLNTGGDDTEGPDDPPAGEPVDGLPELLVPPDVTETFSLGGDSWIVSTTITYDEAVAFYTEALGAPLFEDANEKTALWNAQVGNRLTSVGLTDEDGTVQIISSILS
jgi:hypothetical protein